MKKLSAITVCLVFMLALTLVSCGSSEEPAAQSGLSSSVSEILSSITMEISSNISSISSASSSETSEISSVQSRTSSSSTSSRASSRTTTSRSGSTSSRQQSSQASSRPLISIPTQPQPTLPEIIPEPDPQPQPVPSSQPTPSSQPVTPSEPEPSSQPEPSQPSPSSQPDTSSEAVPSSSVSSTSTVSSSVTYDSVEDYINENRDIIDEIVASMEQDGITGDIYARGNSLVFSLKFTIDIGDTSVIKEYLDQMLDEGASLFESIVYEMRFEIPSAESVIVEYLDMDGNVITSKEYK